MFANKINVPAAWVLCLLRQAGSLSRKNLCGRKSSVNPAKRYVCSLGAWPCAFPRRCCGSWKDFRWLQSAHPSCVSIMAGLLSPMALSPRPHPSQSVLSSKDCLCLIQHLQSLLFSLITEIYWSQLHGTFCSFPNRPHIFFIDLVGAASSIKWYS